MPARLTPALGVALAVPAFLAGFVLTAAGGSQSAPPHRPTPPAVRTLVSAPAVTLDPAAPIPRLAALPAPAPPQTPKATRGDAGSGRVGDADADPHTDGHADAVATAPTAHAGARHRHLRRLGSP